MCKRGWPTKVNSVGDIGRNIGSELDSVVGSALSQTLSKNWQEMKIVLS